MEPTCTIKDTIAAFFHVRGPDLIGRTESFSNWFSARCRDGVWNFNRVLESRDGIHVRLRNLNGATESGVSFAAQDYLGLNDHEAVHAAVIEALGEYGPHSAGSEMLLGTSRLTVAFQRELGAFLDRDEILLFPTGWAAAYGALRGLVRREDTIVLDRLAHNSLQSGARAATGNIVYFEHNSVASAEEALRSIRAVDPRGAVLLVTESVFSMDSDSPDLRALGELCREYSATFMVDVAHDLGALGPSGLGRLEEQDALHYPDIIMGAFSKTFCTTGGFLALPNRSVGQYVRCFGDSNTFSNAMTPLQIAAARASLGVVRSPEGRDLRQKLLDASTRLRGFLLARDLTVTGEPTAIIPVMTGPERAGRDAAAYSDRAGALVNFVEYPAVALGASRLRLQISPAHAEIDLNHFADIIAKSIHATTRQATNAIGGGASR